ncbi:MAG: hypothetical protein AAF138_05535 [Planctomycetota bacterium]
MNAELNTKPGALRVLGLALIVLAALAQAQAVFDPFPHWATDPWIAFTPATGFGPTAVLLLNAAGILGAACCLFACIHERQPIRAWAVIAATLGLAPVAYHGFVRAGLSYDDLRLGAAWTAGVLAAVALSRLPRPAWLHTACVAVTLSLLGAVVVKSVGQVFHELPQTIETFERQQDAFLQSRGWEADGPQARAFERRLLQPNATAWFAMPNVAAAAAALGVIVGAGLALGPGRKAPRAAALALAGASAAMLWTTGARAAMALALTGVVAVLLLGVVDRFRRAHAWARRPLIVWIVGLGGPACVAIGLMLRGLLGERLGDLSILFRSQYAVGAARVSVDHPLLGVGPDGFQSAYQRVKIPFSPEDVASPHSTPLDFIATLGLGGWAWVALLVAACVLLAMAGLQQRAESEAEPAPSGPAMPGRAQRWIVLIAGVLPIVTAYTETDALTPVGVLVRICAGVAAGGVAWIVLALGEGRSQLHTRRVLAVAAFVVVLHGLLDVAFVWPNAAPWLGVVVGLAIARPEGNTAAKPVSRPASIAGGAAWAVFAAGLVLVAITRIGPWESRLRDAAAPFAAVALGQEVVNASLADGPPPTAVLRSSAANGLRGWLGRPVPAHVDSIARASAEVAALAGPRARALLAEAASRQPGHLPTARAFGRVWQVWPPEDGDGDALTPVAAARAVVDREPDMGSVSASAWAWLARAYEVEDRLRSASDQRLDERLAALERAAAAAPYSWPHADRLARAYLEAGRSEQARRWAREALDRAEFARLDPLQAPSANVRAELEAIAESP